MNWLSDIFSGNGGDEAREGKNPTERILQLRRGVSAAAAALPEERRSLARRAMEAADAVGDRVAALAELRDRRALVGPEEREPEGGRERIRDEAGAARRREAGGPVRAAVTDESGVPDDWARDAIERLGRLHFGLLQVELNGEDPDALPLEEDMDALRELAERLPAPGEDSGGGSGDGASGGP